MPRMELLRSDVSRDTLAVLNFDLKPHGFLHGVDYVCFIEAHDRSAPMRPNLAFANNDARGLHHVTGVSTGAAGGWWSRIAFRSASIRARSSVLLASFSFFT